MKKAPIVLLCIIPYLIWSGTYNLVDMNYYLGRWGYIKIDPPLTAQDQRVRQEIPKTDINIDIKFDVQTVEKYGNGEAFVQPTYNAAQKWNTATRNIPGVTHVQLNVGTCYISQTYDKYPDNINALLFDIKELFIKKSNRTDAGLTIYTKKRYTLNSICEGQARELLETDIFLHPFSHDLYNWKVLNGTTTDPHDGDGNPDYDLDYETTVLHELGHFLGLGHIMQNAGDWTVMTPTTPFNKIKRDLTTEDIQAIRDLYSQGSDNTGIIPCFKWYNGTDGGMQIICRTVEGAWGDGLGAGCGNNSDDDIYFYTDENGTTHVGFKCVFQDTRRMLPVNNFGISKPAVDNINNYIAQKHPHNWQRSWRATLMLSENGDIGKDYLSRYTSYLNAGRVLDDPANPYANAFTAMDKVIDEFAPVVDATFRCADNEKNPDLFMTKTRITLLTNLDNELLKLDISDRLKNEIFFLNRQLPLTQGMNIRQTYEYLINAKDPELILK